MIRALVAFAAAAATVGLVPSAPASASSILDRNIGDVSLAVNSHGEALLEYKLQNGQLRHVLAWGAVNARTPSPDTPQVGLHYDYSGGWGKYHRLVWKSFRNACRAYDGPALVYVVTACRAPDGSYWAVQAWQRLLPLRGVPPWTPAQTALEFHLSHWTGPLAELDVSPNWTYGGSWQGVFGRMLYGGAPVYGFGPSADGDFRYGRYAYIDTYDSVWGAGWKHAAGKGLHSRNGAFCFSFVPDRPPPGYPNSDIRPAGTGKRYRVTVMGPGVTPDVQWEGPGLGAYDPAADGVFNRLFDEWVGAADAACTRER